MSATYGTGPGWEALDSALGAGADAVRFDLSQGESPVLESIVALPREGHWLFATYGLTELYAKSSPDAESGLGYELTIRVPRKNEANPPSWPVELLRAVATYAQGGVALDAGHHLDFGGSITRGESALCACLVVADRALASFSGPFGAVRFLQLVGVTSDELDLLLDWSAEGIADALSVGSRLLVTDANRASFLHDPQLAARVRERIENEGSSLERFEAELAARVDGSAANAEIALAPAAVEPLRRVLKSRLGHGRPVAIDGTEGVLELVAGDVPGWKRSNEALVVTLPPEVALAWRDELAEQPGNVSRALLQDLWVRIVPTA